jgi:hypothetical protein
MLPTSRNYLIPLIATGAVIVGVAVWRFFGYPTSFDEAIFLYKLSSSVSAGSSELRLAEMMPGDWELVCESHSYDGPLHLKRYNRTYPPAAPSQDGVWGFIFIAKDGSYRSAVGSCGSVGVHLDFDPRVCIERHEANLSLSPGRLELCATFSPSMATTSLQGTLRDNAAQRP